MPSRFLIGAVVLATLSAPQAATAYSVLAHEANVDALWGMWPEDEDNSGKTAA